MTEPLSAWLALRERADHLARSAPLTDALAAALPPARPLRIADFGTGTGSNVRYLSPRLPSPQQWLAVDRDPSLLAHVPRGVETRCLELGSLADPALFANRNLVTASALLDLVSEQWIWTLAERCRDAGAAALFALSYDGRSACSPAEPEDDIVREIFNRHQTRSDKGFGAAAGPCAVDCTVQAFGALGYHVRRERSDWSLEPDDAAMQRELIAGWAEAAIEMAPEREEMIRNWLGRRLAHVDAQRSRIVVGHEDVGAWLPK